MKVGMVGIGDIARKAYLPILGTRSDIELSIASRNEAVIHQVGEQYHINNRFTTLQELIASQIDVAFVHSATAVHAEMLRELIEAGITVFVDKPIAYHLHETEELLQLARAKQVGIMVGFNRRFAPMYRSMREGISRPETILMQKNRTSPVSNLRSTVMDDFIHVVDTLVSFIGEPRGFEVQGKLEEGNVHYLVLHLHGEQSTAIGIMNRHTGVTEERLETMSEGKKQVVHNLVQTILYENDTEVHQGFGDWTTTLYRRGFVDMLDHFFNCVQHHVPFETSGDQVLWTHRICEDIIASLESRND